MPAEDVLALREEHTGIIHRLAAVERCVSAPGFNGRKFRDSTAALGVQLRKHFAHEERAVYQPLNSRLKQSSPTGELMEDHRSIWKAFERLRKVNFAEGSGAASAVELRKRLSSLQLTLS